MNELYPFINSYVFPSLSLFGKIVWTNESDDWPLERIICVFPIKLKSEKIKKKQINGRFGILDFGS